MMAEKILKSIVLYSSSVYLEMIPAGSDVGVMGDLYFPIDANSQPYFHFSIGQMAGQTPDEADFEQLTEVIFEEFPQTSDGLLNIRVMIALYDGKELYVGAEFSPLDSEEVLWAMDPPLGPFQVE
jgi:hypothetical protein